LSGNSIGAGFGLGGGGGGGTGFGAEVGSAGLGVVAAGGIAGFGRAGATGRGAEAGRGGDAGRVPGIAGFAVVETGLVTGAVVFAAGAPVLIGAGLAGDAGRVAVVDFAGVVFFSTGLVFFSSFLSGLVSGITHSPFPAFGTRANRILAENAGGKIIQQSLERRCADVPKRSEFADE
jgi:hypothetical protein